MGALKNALRYKGFYELSPEERAAILEEAAKADEEFQALPEDEQKEIWEYGLTADFEAPSGEPAPKTAFEKIGEWAAPAERSLELIGRGGQLGAEALWNAAGAIPSSIERMAGSESGFLTNLSREQAEIWRKRGEPTPSVPEATGWAEKTVQGIPQAWGSILPLAAATGPTGAMGKLAGALSRTGIFAGIPAAETYGAGGTLGETAKAAGMGAATGALFEGLPFLPSLARPLGAAAIGGGMAAAEGGSGEDIVAGAATMLALDRFMAQKKRANPTEPGIAAPETVEEYRSLVSDMKKEGLSDAAIDTQLTSVFGPLQELKAKNVFEAVKEEGIQPERIEQILGPEPIVQAKRLPWKPPEREFPVEPPVEPPAPPPPVPRVEPPIPERPIIEPLPEPKPQPLPEPLPEPIVAPEAKLEAPAKPTAVRATDVLTKIKNAGTPDQLAAAINLARNSKTLSGEWTLLEIPRIKMAVDERAAFLADRDTLHGFALEVGIKSVPKEKRTTDLRHGVSSMQEELSAIPKQYRKKAGLPYDEFLQEARTRGYVEPGEDISSVIERLKQPREKTLPAYKEAEKERALEWQHELEMRRQKLIEAGKITPEEEEPPPPPFRLKKAPESEFLPGMRPPGDIRQEALFGAEDMQTRPIAEPTLPTRQETGGRGTQDRLFQADEAQRLRDESEARMRAEEEATGQQRLLRAKPRPPAQPRELPSPGRMLLQFRKAHLAPNVRVRILEGGRVLLTGEAGAKMILAPETKISVPENAKKRAKKVSGEDRDFSDAMTEDQLVDGAAIVHYTEGADVFDYRHEFVHVARRLGLETKGERARIERRFGKDEEAQAYGIEKDPTLFDALRKRVERFGNELQSFGYRVGIKSDKPLPVFEDVRKRYHEGTLFAREPGAPGEGVAETAYGMAPAKRDEEQAPEGQYRLKIRGPEDDALRRVYPDYDTRLREVAKREGLDEKDFHATMIEVARAALGRGPEDTPLIRSVLGSEHGRETYEALKQWAAPVQEQGGARAQAPDRGAEGGTRDLVSGRPPVEAPRAGEPEPRPAEKLGPEFEAEGIAALDEATKQDYRVKVAPGERESFADTFEPATPESRTKARKGVVLVRREMPKGYATLDGALIGKPEPKFGKYAAPVETVEVLSRRDNTVMQGEVEKIKSSVTEEWEKLKKLSGVAKIVAEDLETIATRGTISKEAQEEFYSKKLQLKPDTYEKRISQAEADAQKAFLYDLGHKMRAAERVAEANGTPLAVQAFKILKERFIAESTEFRTQGTTMARMLHSRQQAIKDIARILGNPLISNPRKPIYTNLVDTFAKITRGEWKEMSKAERKRFYDDLIDAYRLNLFSVTSFTLDLIGNTSELASTIAESAGRDVAHTFRTWRLTMPSTRGLLRAVPRAFKTAKDAPPELRKIVDQPTTAETGEPTRGNLSLKLQPGAFTEGENVWTRGIDLLAGGPLYMKGATDKVFRRLGFMADLYRQAYEAADASGVRKSGEFVDRWIENAPKEAFERAGKAGRKMGFDRDLSDLEQWMARSNTVKLLAMSFPRWPFNFTRAAGEWLGLNLAQHYRGAIKGSAGPRGEYLVSQLAKMGVGWGAVLLLNSMYDQMDWKTMEYVHENGDRTRLSSREPIASLMWLNAVMRGDMKASTAALKFTSLPFSQTLGEKSGGGLISSVIKTAQDAVRRKKVDVNAVEREITGAVNRAVPGQAVFSLLKTMFDTTSREGVGAMLPGISRLKPAMPSRTTGEKLNVKQRLLGGPEFPQLSGVPIPGAQRVLDPVYQLLSEFGMTISRPMGQAYPGVPPGDVPRDKKREWEFELGRQRNLLLKPLKERLPGDITAIPYGEKKRLMDEYKEWDSLRDSGRPAAMAAQDVWGNGWKHKFLKARQLEKWRKEIQKRDLLAGKRATAIVRSKQH